jgi:hypothetical protein
MSTGQPGWKCSERTARLGQPAAYCQEMTARDRKTRMGTGQLGIKNYWTGQPGRDCQVGTARTEPARTEPARTKSARTKTARIEPARTESART